MTLFRFLTVKHAAVSMEFIVRQTVRHLGHVAGREQD